MVAQSNPRPRPNVRLARGVRSIAVEFERDPTLAASSEPARGADLSGRVLAARYQLRARLGIGGMGAVYLGRDTRLERDVAVKVILGVASAGDTPVDSALLARFVREARAVATLGHPAIVTVFDAGFDGDTPFIVMERLRGESLADRLARGTLPAAEAVRVGARVLEALSAAHAAGLVHRDIKPANVFLCANDGGTNPADVKILDFGVAGVSLDGNPVISGSDQRLTAAGLGVGTPMYMPPEQLRGDPPDARADLYAVGAMLYECLAGRPLYEARNMAELCAQKLTTDPHPLRSLAPSTSDGLAWVVEQALQRDPAQRFANADAMRGALLASAARDPGAPASAAPPLDASTAPAIAATSGQSIAAANATPSTFELPPRASEGAKTPWLWPVAGGIVLGLALFVGVRAYSGRSSRVAAASAPSMEGSSARRPRVDNVDAAALATQPTVGLRTFAQFHDARGSARSLLGAPDLWELAALDFRRAIDAAGSRAPARWIAGEHAARARAKVLRGQLDEGLADARAAIAADPDWATPHVVVAEAHTRKHEVDPALQAVRRAELLEPSWWVPTMTLATVYNQGERWEEAIQALRRAAAMAPEEPTIDDLLALTMHGRALDSEADRYAARALERDPDLLWSHLVRAERALERRDGRVALEEANRVIAISATTAAGHLTRGEALLLLGQREDALASLRRGLDLAAQTRQVGLSAARIARLQAVVSGRNSGSGSGSRLAGRGRTRSPATTSSQRSRSTNSSGGGNGDRSRTTSGDNQGNLGL